jgi:hypothetical protein
MAVGALAVDAGTGMRRSQMGPVPIQAALYIGLEAQSACRGRAGTPSVAVRPETHDRIGRSAREIRWQSPLTVAASR